jgi:hypothetical protein
MPMKKDIKRERKRKRVFKNEKIIQERAEGLILIKMCYRQVNISLIKWWQQKACCAQINSKFLLV